MISAVHRYEGAGRESGRDHLLDGVVSSDAVPPRLGNHLISTRYRMFWLQAWEGCHRVLGVHS